MCDHPALSPNDPAILISTMKFLDLKFDRRTMTDAPQRLQVSVPARSTGRHAC
jgi:hypothetical protein